MKKPIMFGRRIEFDERSRAYPIRTLIPKGTVPRSYTWACGVRLDQGATPRCVGYSIAQEGSARPVKVPNVTPSTADKIYRRAQDLDQWPGHNYDGTSVLAGIKAAAELGWYPEFRWAFSERDLCLAVGWHGPAVLGINWYQDMMTPDLNGIVNPTGAVAGGHAILCNGFNVKSGFYRLANSWGPSWGKAGDCFVSRKDMAYLLAHQGEACIPIRRGGA
jgi:hypothetical protein